MSLHAVLVTYRRPEALDTMLEVLAEQARRLDSLVVVDNGDPRPAEPIERSAAATKVTYLAAGDNHGPAGGLRLGSEHVLAGAADDDWVLFLDDDDPPEGADALADLEAFAEQQLATDPSTGGVGIVGARLDRRRGQLVRVADVELHGAVPVDYVGGGQLPLYRAAALRVALPDPGLFFGFDDLDVGLKLAAAGHTLYVDGDRWRALRDRQGRLGLATSGASASLGEATWRDHYGQRNAVHLLRTHVSATAAARRAVTVVGKAVVHLPRQPKAAWPALRTSVRAVTDGWRGRLGRTVEPG